MSPSYPKFVATSTNNRLNLPYSFLANSIALITFDDSSKKWNKGKLRGAECFRYFFPSFV